MKISFSEKLEYQWFDDLDKYDRKMSGFSNILVSIEFFLCWLLKFSEFQLDKLVGLYNSANFWLGFKQLQGLFDTVCTRRIRIRLLYNYFTGYISLNHLYVETVYNLSLPDSNVLLYLIAKCTTLMIRLL